MKNKKMIPEKTKFSSKGRGLTSYFYFFCGYILTLINQRRGNNTFSLDLGNIITRTIDVGHAQFKN